MVLLSVYPMILMGIIAAYNYEGILKERFIEYSQGNMNRITTLINSDIDEMNNSIQWMLQDPSFNELLVKQPNTPIDSITMFSLRQDIRTYIGTVLFSKKNFDVGGIYFYQNTQNIYYAKEAGLVVESDIPYRDMRFSIEKLKTPTFYFTEIDKHLTIYLIQQVLHKDTFQPLGMIYYRIDPAFLENIIRDSYIQSEESLFLYTKNGKRIGNKGRIEGKDIIENNNYFKSAPDVYLKKFEGEEFYLITDEIQKLDLTLITIVSSDNLTQDSRKVMDLITILYLANIPLFLAMGYFLYGTIVKPVNHLVDKMNMFEKGQFDIQIEGQRHDEFDYMYLAFNKMTKNINALVNDVYFKELARKDAEIAALQEQINPHFLYNTLESINWRAQIAGEKEIATMIRALSKLMDGSINRNNEKFITMKQEIDYMHQYMYLIKMRYTDSLTYELDCDIAVETCLVPKLIIQPLLENAVKHGIEAVGEGTIKLKAYGLEDSLIIEVEDNGIGMNPIILEHVQESIEHEKKSIHTHLESRESIGLRNVARRIHLIYGEEAEINIVSELNIGTKIILKLPKGVKDGSI
jgi:two-component system, sensor histidine kinase YesM